MALAGILRYIPFLPRIRPAEIRRLLEDKSFDVRPMIDTLGFTPIPLRGRPCAHVHRQELTMPIINRIAEFHREMTEWRQDLHAHPELALQETRTSGVVQAKLKEFGVDEIITGMARTGVVGVIRGHGSSERAIGLRADMDALPILEETGAPYASQNHGVMHACGHDGHTTMLLGAAKYLAETRNFDGTVYVIFQPAEENLAGGDDHGEGRPVRALPDGDGVRHAQLAADAGRHLRLAQRPGHGGGGEHRDHHHRQGHARRACRISAPIRS